MPAAISASPTCTVMWSGNSLPESERAREKSYEHRQKNIRSDFNAGQPGRLLLSFSASGTVAAMARTVFQRLHHRTGTPHPVLENRKCELGGRPARTLGRHADHLGRPYF